MISKDTDTSDTFSHKKGRGPFIRHIRETFYLSVPIIIGHLGHMLMSVTDNVMVGRIGAVSLAAAGLSNVLFFLVMVMGIGISVAITPLVAQFHGSGNKKECGLVLRQGILLSIFSGIILFIITLLFVKILDFLNQPDEVVALSRVYMIILGFSIFPMMVFQSCKQFAEGLSITTSAMVITILANIVNVFINWVFIFGNLGAPAMGLAGAGLGTFFSRVFMAAAMVMVVVKSPYLKSFEPFVKGFHIHMPMIKKLLGIGVPTGLQYVFEVSSFAGASVLMGWLGTRELAAHQIALNLTSISYMFSLGVSAASTVRVGVALGRKSTDDARLAGYSAIFLISLFMVAFATVLICFRSYLPSLYIKQVEVVLIASQILLVAGLFQFPDGIQAVCAGMLRGGMDVKIPTFITFAAYWLVGLPIGYILGIRMKFGVTGVWIGLLMGLSASAVMLLIRFQRFISKKKHYIFKCVDR